MRRTLALLGILVLGFAALWVLAGEAKVVNPGKIEIGTKPALPAPRLAYGARQGRELYLHYCANCHGDEGHGDGFNAYSLDPKPRDLSDREFQQKRSDEDLGNLIRSGGVVAGMSTAMPPWGRTLTGRQIHYIVSYVRALPATHDEVP